MRKVGGLYFFNVGLFGGSVYLNKPLLVEKGNTTLLAIYCVMIGYCGVGPLVAAIF